jgi:hypothetical protein
MAGIACSGTRWITLQQRLGGCSSRLQLQQLQQQLQHGLPLQVRPWRGRLLQETLLQAQQQEAQLQEEPTGEGAAAMGAAGGAVVAQQLPAFAKFVSLQRATERNEPSTFSALKRVKNDPYEFSFVSRDCAHGRLCALPRRP